MEYGCFSTKLGKLCGLVDGGKVFYLDTLDVPEYRKHPQGSVIRLLEKELTEYLDGKKQIFSFKPVVQGPYSRRRVLEEVTRIPCGKTITYKELAVSAGIRSPRLVGRILSENNILIIIPCHRVVSVKGLGGYKLGVDVKKMLLDIERSMCGDGNGR